jgi:HAD superfamily hydrolase (TIGR01509 family)
MFLDKRYIIFDLDGTLIDSSGGVIASTNYALMQLGQPPRSPEEIKRFIGHPLEEMFSSFTDAPMDKLKEKFQEKARETIIPSTQAMPGTDEILRLLYQARYRMAVATTKYINHTHGIIAKMGWTPYFAATASGDEVAQVKPAPDLVLLAMKRLGASGDKTVMIGDTVNDIKAARAAGISVIAIRSPFGEDDLNSHHPNMLLPRFTDLKTVFNL